MKRRRSVNRRNVAKLTTKMNANIKRRNDSVMARRFVTVGVIVSILMVGVSLFVAVYFKPEAVAKRKLEELATMYYENYYYDRFMEEIDPELKDEKLKTYEKTGFQPVLLRQLLLCQNGKYASYKVYFEKEEYKCDKNKTSVKFYPVEPYGSKDYTVEYNYSCASDV